LTLPETLDSSFDSALLEEELSDLVAPPRDDFELPIELNFDCKPTEPPPTNFEEPCFLSTFKLVPAYIIGFNKLSKLTLLLLIEAAIYRFRL
jgi:hypothetical protein